MKSKTIDISIVMILRAKLMKMESEEWRNSLKTYCYSSRIAKLVPDPEKLWKMMTGEYKEEVKVPKERVKTNSKTLLNMEPNFKAFHGNKEHRNEIEFKFKQLIKYSMFMEPPYKLYKIQTDINLAYKICGYIYGQKYLTNKDINSLYGFNTAIAEIFFLNFMNLKNKNLKISNLKKNSKFLINLKNIPKININLKNFSRNM